MFMFAFKLGTLLKFAFLSRSHGQIAIAVDLWQLLLAILLFETIMLDSYNLFLLLIAIPLWTWWVWFHLSHSGFTWRSIDPHREHSILNAEQLLTF